MTAASAVVVLEGDLLWTPSPAFVENARITQFTRWLEEERGLSFADYEALRHWSISEVENFWRAIWDYFEIMSDAPFERAVSGDTMFRARWFDGARTNYAEHILRYEAKAAPDETALFHSTELRPPSEMSWHQLGAQVRILATKLRAMGIRTGDRIVCYMPNIPETVVAMLATVAVGAVWSAAAPEFGSKTVMERFGQIKPKLAFVADGYSFNGRQFDRRGEIATIAASLPSLETLVWLPYLGLDRAVETDVPMVDFAALVAGPLVEPASFHFERVPADHPLWILFSSGTTGLPKAIVHGHAGLIAEHLKCVSLHVNLGPGKRSFFYTTTGWMMWNSLVSGLITGAAIVLYDGSPTFGSVDMLWRMAEQTRATMFGASPSLVQIMKKANVVPGAQFDLSRIDTIMLGGAPATPETFQWLYENVREDVWIASTSGGTEICSGLAVCLPTLPVYAGEIQCRPLGIDVHVWNDDGHELIGESGELVVTAALPSAPLYFWNDQDDARYFESYFSTFPGVWRHGDIAKINRRGGVYIYGRSDSTLNRFGVRIGSAEIYRVLEQVPAVTDSLIICCETPNGGFYMPLFVSLSPGTELTETLKKTIIAKLREDASPRHVPDEIHQVPAVPYTLTGKKMEVPIRKLVMGMAPEKVASRDTMANPMMLDWYIEFAARPEVSLHRSPA